MTTAELTGAQLLAIDALARGCRLNAAAKAAGVDRTTLWTWRTRDAAFQAKLREIQAAAIEATKARLVGMSERAVGVVEAILHDRGERAADRLKAAGMVMELAGLRSDSTTSVDAGPPALTDEVIAKATRWLEEIAADNADREKRHDIRMDTTTRITSGTSE